MIAGTAWWLTLLLASAGESGPAAHVEKTEGAVRIETKAGPTDAVPGVEVPGGARVVPGDGRVDLRSEDGATLTLARLQARLQASNEGLRAISDPLSLEVSPGCGARLEAVSSEADGGKRYVTAAGPPGCVVQVRVFYTTVRIATGARAAVLVDRQLIRVLIQADLGVITAVKSDGTVETISAGQVITDVPFPSPEQALAGSLVLCPE